MQLNLYMTAYQEFRRSMDYLTHTLCCPLDEGEFKAYLSVCKVRHSRRRSSFLIHAGISVVEDNERFFYIWTNERYTHTNTPVKSLITHAFCSWWSHRENANVYKLADTRIKNPKKLVEAKMELYDDLVRRSRTQRYKLSNEVCSYIGATKLGELTPYIDVLQERGEDITAIPLLTSFSYYGYLLTTGITHEREG